MKLPTIHDVRWPALLRMGLILLCAACGGMPARAEAPVPRVIVALFDGGEGRNYEFTRLHRLAEMPLNHLGLVVIPHDIRAGLPSADMMRDARGVISWFSSTPIDDPAAYLAWLEEQMDSGKRLVILGDVGFGLSSLSSIATRRSFDRIMTRIGVEWRGGWVSLTYGTKIVAHEASMVEFERPYPRVLRPYMRIGAAGREARSFLSVARRGQGDDDDLVVIGPAGGYVAPGFAALVSDEPPLVRAWYIDPFQFFRVAFATDEVPKLDTTTMSGRRIFYSHIDGDAWHNVATLERYRDRRVVAADVVYEQILLKYSDLPATVAPVTGDLDPAWYGSKEAQELARKMFALPNVEAGTHTHSHPFAWMFFRNYDRRREAPFLPFYPARPGRTQDASVWDETAAAEGEGDPPKPIDGVYQRPRSYAVKPFDLNLEIAGSVAIVQSLLPPGKRVEILQWSGDTAPWDEVVALTRAARLRNINGGDPRMDGQFDSYAWVSPLARRVGKEWQIYSSGANENIYTDNWRRRHYAFRYLVDALRNMETPIRVKPINVYYHFYSAEREEGLGSLFVILDYVRTQNVAPVATSRFAAMVDGFLNARIVNLGERRWRIENRDGLETVRFDRASMLSVDFARSEGVIGQTHFQGSLYVALDSGVEEPIVALAGYDRPDRAPEAAQAYLIEARWRVSGHESGAESWKFHAAGFGPGQFTWKVPRSGRYTVTADAGDGPDAIAASAGQDGVLRFTLALAGEGGVDVAVHREGTAQ